LKSYRIKDPITVELRAGTFANIVSQYKRHHENLKSEMEKAKSNMNKLEKVDRSILDF